MTFGQKLQQLRRARGLSQEDLAQQLSVTRQTISKWELDQSTPDLPYLAAISEYFGVTTDYLIKEQSAGSVNPTVQVDIDTLLAQLKQHLFSAQKIWRFLRKAFVALFVIGFICIPVYFLEQWWLRELWLKKLSGFFAALTLPAFIAAIVSSRQESRSAAERSDDL